MTLRLFIGLETAALTFRTKQYSSSCSSHICYGKRFYNDFFLNHDTTTLVHNCLKLLRCVVIGWNEKESIILTVSFQLPFKPGFHYTANATTTTQKQSDYKVEQSSFTLIAFFYSKLVVVVVVIGFKPGFH